MHEDTKDYGVSSDGKCLKCGATLFNVVPFKTTREEIISFAQKSKDWDKNPDALDGWMPSGLFCPNGCVAVHVDYPPPWPPEPIDNTVYGVFIVSPGPKRLEIISYVRQLTDMSPKTAKALLDNPTFCIFHGKKHELANVVESLEKLGAIVSIRKYEEA